MITMSLAARHTLYLSESTSSSRSTRRWHGRVRPSRLLEDQELIGQFLQTQYSSQDRSLGVAWFGCLCHLGFDVDPDCSERATEFMAGVRDQPPLTFERPLETAQKRIQGGDELLDFVSRYPGFAMRSLRFESEISDALRRTRSTGRMALPTTNQMRAATTSTRSGATIDNRVASELVSAETPAIEMPRPGFGEFPVTELYLVDPELPVVWRFDRDETPSESRRRQMREDRSDQGCCLNRGDGRRR